MLDASLVWNFTQRIEKLGVRKAAIIKNNHHWRQNAFVILYCLPSVYRPRKGEKQCFGNRAGVLASSGTKIRRRDRYEIPEFVRQSAKNRLQIVDEMPRNQALKVTLFWKFTKILHGCTPVYPIYVLQARCLVHCHATHQRGYCKSSQAWVLCPALWAFLRYFVWSIGAAFLERPSYTARFGFLCEPARTLWMT